MVHHAHTIGREHGDVAVGEKENLAGVLEKSGNIASDEVLTPAEADNRRRAHARGDDFLRVVGGNKNQRIDSAQLAQRPAHGFLERHALHVFLDEVRNNFGVGFGDELVAFTLEHFLQLQVVFDDAVVDDDKLPGAVPVGMRVLFRGAAVRGPACVADAVRAGDGRLLDDLFEVAQFARGAADFHLAGAIDHGNAGRIVAAVFQAAEAINDQGNDFLGADITDNPAHAWDLLTQTNPA